MEIITRRSLQMLKMLYEKGKATTTFTIRIKQDELAKQLGISRQALNAHFRRLRDQNLIRTGRGFIDVTERGMNTLGISTTPAFILIKVSPTQRIQVYKEISGLTVQRAFRLAGDVDALLMVEREKLDEVLKRLYSIEGIQDTKSYVTIETIK